MHTAQLALLARAADDENGLALHLGSDTFILREQRMTDQEREVNAKPWSLSMVAIARALATALDRVRDLTRRLGLREKAIAHREVAAKEREAELARERMAQDARRAEHEAAMLLLDRQRAVLESDEARAATAAKLAAEQLKAASAQQAAANAALAENARWMRVMDALKANPDAIEVAEGGLLRLDRRLASASPELARAFEAKPPAWVVSLAVQRLDLADEAARAGAREKEASYAAERLTSLLHQAGPIFTPEQKAVSEQATRLIRAFVPGRDNLER